MSGVFVGVRLAVHGRAVSPLPSKPRLLRAIRASSALRKGEELGVCVCIHICIYTGCLLFLRLPYPLHSFSYTRSKPPSSSPLGFYLFKLASTTRDLASEGSTTRQPSLLYNSNRILPIFNAPPLLFEAGGGGGAAHKRCGTVPTCRCDAR